MAFSPWQGNAESTEGADREGRVPRSTPLGEAGVEAGRVRKGMHLSEGRPGKGRYTWKQRTWDDKDPWFFTIPLDLPNQLCGKDGAGAESDGAHCVGFE